MKLVLHDGTIRDVNTKYIFDNQYDTVNGVRIFDTQVKRIIDDVRLGEFYCCNGKQGSYDEVAQAIANERAKIYQCQDCYWHHKHTRIADECTSETIIQDNKKIVRKQDVYEISCAYKNGCAHDIPDTPVLFREKNFCFFCEYPEGIPDQQPLRQFMIDNASHYNIVPYFENEELSINNSFKHDKPFGSYRFRYSSMSNRFEVSNARNRFEFHVDYIKQKFILVHHYSYMVTNKLCTQEYDHTTQSSKLIPIKNYDKFATWFWAIVNDFNNTQRRKIS